jgi:phenylalanyl-tRNA synthetase beta chain
MKILLSWLKEVIDLPLNPQEIAQTLTRAGIEVEGFERVPMGFSKVIVAKVTEVQPHPNADKLCVATVTDGTETLQVVCGAPNCHVGMKTAFAPVGATLTDEEGKEFKIKKVKMRGVESSGMLCAGKELGISEDESGIVEFAEHLQLGIDVADLYADTVFEISLTPNLGHCSSVFGIARELAAATGAPFQMPTVSIQEDEKTPIEEAVNIVVKDPENCPRYTARVIEGIQVAESPQWLKDRLTACGMRPVNNVVDATNYVMLECGHPMHAFDLDHLEGEIIIRSAGNGETIETLDGKSRTLTSDMLVIADAKKPVAVAGVMGGLKSEVTNGTKRILLESAYFRPGSVRKTSKRMGLKSESSHRFERGTDPNGLVYALNRVTSLIGELTHGRVRRGILDIKFHEFPTHVYTCRLSRINDILGTMISANEVETIFHRLGFGTTFDGQNTFTLTIPTSRNDVQGEIDLIEEVARIYGYDNIPRRVSHYSASTIPHAPIFLFEREMKSRLIGAGLQEFLTCDLIGPAALGVIQEAPSSSQVTVLNPTSVEQSILRTSLLPGLLQVVKYNVDHQNFDLSGFEVGRIHFKQDGGYKEQSVAGIVLTGKRSPHHHDPKPTDMDFFDLKGILENLFVGMGMDHVFFKRSNLPQFHSGRQATLHFGALEIGAMGEIHPSIQRKLDVSQRILFAELNLHDLFPLWKRDWKIQPLPIFPGSERDWTLSLKNEVPIQEVIKSIRSVHSTLLEEVSLLDIYRSDSLGADKKNATFHFVYRDSSKTVSQEEVDNEHTRLTQAVLAQLEGQIL